MNAMYRMVREELHTEELGNYVSYGIDAMDGGRTLAHISDISTHRERVDELVEKLNRLDVQVIHLTDIVLDYIA